MKKSRKFAISTVPVLGSVFLTAKAFAQENYPSSFTESPIGLPNPGGPTDLATWVPQVLNLAIGLAALICVVILIFSGYMYITAGGDETKVEKATKSLTYAIVGLVICVISVILVQFVLKSVLGGGVK
jgi:hypothetical protein